MFWLMLRKWFSTAYSSSMCVCVCVLRDGITMKNISFATLPPFTVLQLYSSHWVSVAQNLD